MSDFPLEQLGKELHSDDSLGPTLNFVFISPNFLLLKRRVTAGKRKMDPRTMASVLILQQVDYDFTNVSLSSFTSKIPG